MFQRSNQLSVHENAFTPIEPSVLKPLDWSTPRAIPGSEMHNGNIFKVESIIDYTQKLQDDLQKLGIKIKKHEENLRFLKTQTDNLDESILDMQVSLGKYHSSNGKLMDDEKFKDIENEEKTIEQILQQEKSAASILCQLKIRHGSQALHLQLTKDVLGVVATLGKVNNDNLSRLLSEYLGLETMMAVVCKTHESMKALETYDLDGGINKSTGLYGVGASFGRSMDGRFLVICLEDLRPYDGGLLADDPQRRLALLKPRLPSGECPPGFMGFAVNMIELDFANLCFLTAGGHGLRETLFHCLFSRLQVYGTRAEMQLALPCISDGAISLDGGMIRSSGVYCLGNRKEVAVRFPISYRPTLPVEYLEIEERIKTMHWERERIFEDMQREQMLLDHVRRNFDSKKQEYVRFLAESSAYATEPLVISVVQVDLIGNTAANNKQQVQLGGGRSSLRPELYFTGHKG